MDALRRDLEKSAGERLQAESARAAAEASKEAAEQQRKLAIDQAGALAVELKTANDKLAEVSSSLAAAEANEAATARQAGEQKKALEEQYRVMKEMSESALATVQQDLTAALAEAKGLRERMDTATTALASTEASLKAANERNLELKRVHDEQYRTLKESHEKALADLRQAFSALSAEALKQAQPEFLRLANETLAKFNESAKGDLAQRQESIATLVKPLEEQLKNDQNSGRLRVKRLRPKKLGEVSKHLSTLTQQSMALSTETLQLRKVLSSSQARGRWGEDVDVEKERLAAAGGVPEGEAVEVVGGEGHEPHLGLIGVEGVERGVEAVEELLATAEIPIEVDLGEQEREVLEILELKDVPLALVAGGGDGLPMADDGDFVAA